MAANADGEGLASSLAARPGPGSREVQSSVTAVLTRIQFAHSRDVIQAYGRYRRVRSTAESVSGYLASALLVDGLDAVLIFSVWADANAIPRFGTTVRDHVEAGNWAYARARRTGGRPQVWSTRWRLDSVSNNLSWDGFDLMAHLHAWEPDIAVVPG